MPNNNSPRQRKIARLWMRDMIAWVGLWWKTFDHTDTRRSATEIAKLIRNTFGEPAEQFIPSTRTINRIWARTSSIMELRQLNKISPVRLFDKEWPQDPDDSAFLIALFKHWGYDAGVYTTGISDPHSDMTEILSHMTHSTIARFSSFNMADETKIIDALELYTADDIYSVFPLSTHEIKCALSLKTTFGWPESFNVARPKTHIRYSYNMVATTNIPWELAIIKELSFRILLNEIISDPDSDQYKNLSGAVLPDNSDILRILLDNTNPTEESPEHTGPPLVNMYNRLLWPANTANSLDVIQSDGEGIIQTHNLQRLMDQYFGHGNYAEHLRIQIADLMGELGPPPEILFQEETADWLQQYKSTSSWRTIEYSYLYFLFFRCHYEIPAEQPLSWVDYDKDAHEPLVKSPISFGAIYWIRLPANVFYYSDWVRTFEDVDNPIIGVWCSHCQAYYLPAEHVLELFATRARNSTDFDDVEKMPYIIFDLPSDIKLFHTICSSILQEDNVNVSVYSNNDYRNHRVLVYLDSLSSKYGDHLNIAGVDPRYQEIYALLRNARESLYEKLTVGTRVNPTQTF